LEKRKLNFSFISIPPSLPPTKERERKKDRKTREKKEKRRKQRKGWLFRGHLAE
jgi:hypothetical protein